MSGAPKPVRTAARLFGAGVLILVVAAAHAPARAADPAPAPAFTLTDLRGEPLSLDTLRSRGPVLLDFWATWCKPCLAAIPELERLHKDLGPRGLTVVGISVDGPRNQSKVRPFASRLGITYPVAIDAEGTVQQRYQVRAMPTTVLIDTDGKIVKRVQGFRPGEVERLRKEIEPLLAEPAE